MSVNSESYISTQREYVNSLKKVFSDYENGTIKESDFEEKVKTLFVECKDLLLEKQDGVYYIRSYTHLRLGKRRIRLVLKSLEKTGVIRIQNPRLCTLLLN